MLGHSYSAKTYRMCSNDIFKRVYLVDPDIELALTYELKQFVNGFFELLSRDKVVEDGRAQKL